MPLTGSVPCRMAKWLHWVLAPHWIWIHVGSTFELNLSTISNFLVLITPKSLVYEFHSKMSQIECWGQTWYLKILDCLEKSKCFLKSKLLVIGQKHSGLWFSVPDWLLKKILLKLPSPCKSLHTVVHSNFSWLFICNSFGSKAEAAEQAMVSFNWNSCQRYFHAFAHLHWRWLC